MKRVKSLALQRPLAFGLVITFVFILLVLISSIVAGAIWPAETSGWFFGSAVGRLLSIFILLSLLSGLGWINSAGFASLGRWQTWLILLVPLEYSIVSSAFAMTGILSFGYTDPILTGLAVLFIFVHAFLEEVVFRGMILHSLMRLSGNTQRGPLMSVLISSLFFGGMHIIYLAGEPISIVLWRIVVALLLGILFGALVVHGGSIYPAVFFHGLLNVAGYLNLTGNATEGTQFTWWLLGIIMLPLALFGLFVLRDVSQLFLRSNKLLSNKYPAR